MCACMRACACVFAHVCVCKRVCACACVCVMFHGGKVVKHRPLGVCSGTIHSNPQSRMLTFPGIRDVL